MSKPSTRIVELEQGRYPGGKNAGGTWQWICSRMPAHATYIEPFAGSFAVGRRKTPALRSIAIDIDPDVVAWLGRQPGLQAIQGCGIEYLECERGATCRDERTINTEYSNLGPDVLVYCDPPYLMSTRTKKRIYANEWSDADHDRFLAVVTTLRCPVMISGYWSDKYRDALPWPCQSLQVMTRGGTKRTEYLWTNYILAERRFLWGEPLWTAPANKPGEGWRERQRIARLVTRWRENYSRRPPQERRAILEALLAEEGGS